MDPEHSRHPGRERRRAATLLGYTREELLATPISRIHPAELPSLSELLERVLRDGRASTIKLTCRTKSGTFLPTEISLHKLELDGETRILGLVQDRSEHRQRGAPVAHNRLSVPHRPRSAADGNARAEPPRESETSVTTTNPKTHRTRTRARRARREADPRLPRRRVVVADTGGRCSSGRSPYYPTYYFPRRRRPDGCSSPRRAHRPLAEPRRRRRLHGARRRTRSAPGAAAAVRAVALRRVARHRSGSTGRAMDAWFEEDEQVFTHPRDPYTRVDILPSSRHVRVEVDGVTVAESTKPTLLFETGLPARYYLPKTDVRMDLLTPTDTSATARTRARPSYWSLSQGDDRPSRTSPGRTGRRCPRARRSPASSASTPRRSTSTSTGNASGDGRGRSRGHDRPA